MNRRIPLSFALSVLLSTTPAYAQFGPFNPPPGVNAFRSMSKRAAWIRDAVMKLNPKANGDCIYAVALEMVGLAELAWSNNVELRGNKPRTVRKGEEQAFKDAVHKNARAECNDPGDGPPSPGGTYETVRGLLSFASESGAWKSENAASTERSAIRAAEAIVKLGVFAPAASVPLPAAAAGPALILDPSLFYNPTLPPEDGT